MTLLDALGVVINPKRWFRGGGTVEMIPEEDAISLCEPGYETERPPPTIWTSHPSPDGHNYERWAARAKHHSQRNVVSHV